MDRKDFYFRQKVTEGELDEAFDAVEAADHNLLVDRGLLGLLSGSVTEKSPTPNISVDVSATVGYDQEGQRINIPSAENVDVSVDYTDTSTDVAGSGNEKIVSLFVEFERSLSDPRVDGYSQTVFFDRDESYAYFVRQGAESTPPATPPALEADKLLLADITRSYGQTQIFDADIDANTRRQFFYPIATGTVVVNPNYKGTVKRGTFGQPYSLMSEVMAHINNEYAQSGIDEWVVYVIGEADLGLGENFTIPNTIRKMVFFGTGYLSSRLYGEITWQVNSNSYALVFVDCSTSGQIDITGSLADGFIELEYRNCAQRSYSLDLSGMSVTSGGMVFRMFGGATPNSNLLEFRGNASASDKNKIYYELRGVKFAGTTLEGDCIEAHSCIFQNKTINVNATPVLGVANKLIDCEVANGFTLALPSSGTVQIDARTNWYFKNKTTTLTNVTKEIQGDTTA